MAVRQVRLKALAQQFELGNISAGLRPEAAPADS